MYACLIIIFKYSASMSNAELTVIITIDRSRVSKYVQYLKSNLSHCTSENPGE